MRLAIFDLDNTLLAGDSDYLWGQFLVEQDRVDGQWYERENRRYYEQYKAGTLDIREFCAFSLKPLTQHEPDQLYAWREQFVREKIAPIVAPGAPALLERHRAQGDRLLIMTATNRFITEPVAALLGVDDLIATDPEIINGRYTGRISGIPNFHQGKVQRLQLWRDAQPQRYDHTTFYSDSRNDIPLLLTADTPVAVDPDDALRAEAERRGWPVISLRTEGYAPATPD
ncbi:MAG TPA: HAD family hydrolase [Stenotrophobium sp.]|jgi:HAD superfamily hydrolase (TIGR01490 family)|nr:HAD family hydrolase [Stenotrophobium sp.]